MKAFMSSHHPGRFVGACGLIGLPLRPALSISEVQAHSAAGAVHEALAILAESEPIVNGASCHVEASSLWRMGDAAPLAEAISSFLES